MTVPGYRDAPIETWDPAAPIDPGEAEEFLRQCYAENPRLGPVEPRLSEVRAQLAETGVYRHTADELSYGAKLAWRNASRCIGRLYWRSLVVLDRRDVTAADGIFDALVHHLHLAGGTDAPSREPGTIRPVISVFAPATPGRPYPRVWNDQLIRYAGYRNADGSVTGDPRSVGFTAAVREFGWTSKGDAFDVLPLAIETPDEGLRLFELPDRAVLEVPLAHPELPWFADLGLRWHAVPAISNMRLTIGGLHYPLAPFNGWYMGTEIGARNLADPDRYDMLPEVARRMGLDTSRASTLWRDRALVELNRAVLWSYERAGVKISDHHTESERFLAHVRNEERAGRQVPADWSWIVPPLSGGATGVFHRYYHEADLRPNFYLDDEARALSRGDVPAPAGRHAAQRSVAAPEPSAGASEPLVAAPEPLAGAPELPPPALKPDYVALPWYAPGPRTEALPLPLPWAEPPRSTPSGAGPAPQPRSGLAQPRSGLAQPGSGPAQSGSGSAQSGSGPDPDDASGAESPPALRPACPLGH
ncbi:nitric-oxide synthase [Micromonospora pattaloongensis]|uniref:Nitric-oxide synthase n=1 Tax=Micromonospora pattaloongensis TaxID=405436 RepID=A0A1H3LRS3_9ACTN|nr:nitric oxide synthase oxygenase [Micromonospora pattaloongensis]SDY67247.1 nitric-oxide synthase [Micromonospora pattaloongensis]